jgi:hypothetical protein
VRSFFVQRTILELDYIVETKILKL